MTSIIPQSNNNFVLPNSLSITWLNALTIPSAGLGIKSNVTTTYAPKAVAKIAIANRTNATGNEVTVKFNKLL